jgi:hypothetical protein
MGRWFVSRILRLLRKSVTVWITIVMVWSMKVIPKAAVHAVPVFREYVLMGRWNVLMVHWFVSRIRRLHRKSAMVWITTVTVPLMKVIPVAAVPVIPVLKVFVPRVRFNA